MADTIDAFIADVQDPKLLKVMVALLDAIKDIAARLRTASTETLPASFNDFGDEQLAIDIMADGIIFSKLKESGCCAVASSEESPAELPQGGEGYSVAFDPLDGSSIIDTNFAVGTICGIWPGGTLIGVRGSDMAASIVAQYGPRVCVTIALKDRDGAHEFTLNGDDWLRSNTFTEVSEGKLFAPGNLRCTQDAPGYRKLVDYWLENKYSLRYSGGMVPDVMQLLTKRKGIFVAPSSPSAPAKLRLLYEVMPMAMLVEKGGGSSSDGKESIMDRVTLSTEDRTQVALGSAKEVKRFEEMVGYAESYLVVSKDDPNWRPDQTR
mmetsp:Transcript_37453/g.73239  ORF Transcript_37453/g.73239 Transcript_37453/m.73239 type:complete len:322 (+) Transcript_37453:66-1031(+)